MSVTGRFRPELTGSTPRPAREVVPPVPRVPAAPAPVEPPPGTPYSTWVDRMQRTRSRHAAITRNLYTWSSYKNWTDRVRDSWSADAAPETEPPKRPR
jgi:hypothetical protein